MDRWNIPQSGQSDLRYRPGRDTLGEIFDTLVRLEKTGIRYSYYGDNGEGAIVMKLRT